MVIEKVKGRLKEINPFSSFDDRKSIELQRLVDEREELERRAKVNKLVSDEKDKIKEIKPKGKFGFKFDKEDLKKTLKGFSEGLSTLGKGAENVMDQMTSSDNDIFGNAEPKKKGKKKKDYPELELPDIFNMDGGQ